MDTGEMQEKLRNLLNGLNWSGGVSKDQIMELLVERDDALRTMVDEYIPEGTYTDVFHVMTLIPAEAWQASQGDEWRGAKIQYVEDVTTGFDESPVADAPGSQDRRYQQGSGGSGTPHAGNPGDGAGRTENPGTQHAGVWPVSGPPPDDPDLPMQGMASFGQGSRGAAGYEDSGRSEVFTVPPESSSQGGSGSGTRHGSGVGQPGANAGEVDPKIGGSGETTGEPPAETGGAGMGNAVGGGAQGSAPRTADKPSSTSNS